MTTRAGWYPDPDPSTPEGQRFWDGQRWTEHRAQAWAPADSAGSPGTGTHYGRLILLTGLGIWICGRVSVLVVGGFGSAQADAISRNIGAALLLPALLCLLVGGILWTVEARKRPRKPPYDW